MWRATIAFLFCVLFSSASLAQKRVALVIGNSAYQHTPTLANPRNDATDMSAALKKLGFQVIEGFDLDKASFDRKVRDFADELPSAKVGVFFYAGHGLQVAGQNYLVPVDAKLSTAAALDWEMVRLDLVQRTMERETETNVIFLDACRDNPLARNLARAMGTRSAEIGRGLAATEGGVGTLISFSTQPGNVALDGSGRNSPFAGALVKRIGSSSNDLSALLIEVRNDVRKETQNRQVPWEHSALTGRFFFAAREPVAEPGQQVQPEAQAGPRPLPRSGVTAGGLFTEENVKQLRTLAEKHSLPLPDFQIELPDADVPAHLRRFVGIWIDGRGSRAKMVIATRVHKDGELDGYWLWGPPGSAMPKRFRYPAGLFQFVGTVTDRTLRFSNPDGKASTSLTLSHANRMNYVYSSTTGEAGATVLTPVWTLVEAERSAKH